MDDPTSDTGKPLRSIDSGPFASADPATVANWLQGTPAPS